MYTTVQKLFSTAVNTFIEQGHIQLIKRERKGICNVIKIYFSKKCCSFELSVNQRIYERDSLHKNIKQHTGIYYIWKYIQIENSHVEGFWGKHSMIFLHVVDFNWDQKVEGPNCSFKGLYTVRAKEYGSHLVKLYILYTHIFTYENVYIF